MINVPINEAESIFEKFWDGGESYPNNEKYSPLANYTVTYEPGTVAEVEQEWCDLGVMIQSQKAEKYAVKIERDCHLDITGYNIFRLFGSVAKAILLRVRCVIDGKEITVIESGGLGVTGEYDGKISGSLITHISMEFGLVGDDVYRASVLWLGLSNEEKQRRMEDKKSPYDTQWEGCFAEEYEIKPTIGMYFDEKELAVLRERMNKQPFAAIMDTLRKEAREGLQMNPEADITEYVCNPDRRWVRDRDMKRQNIRPVMIKLAFVGLVDQDVAMLKMACRMLLSIAVTPKWTEGIIGSFPGATWHHRSFTEEIFCKACAVTLDWAGSLLTWHGKNVVYDAIIFKGLPRLEADFKTIDYIREMNQGIVFSNGRIHALIALAHRYPRYESWLLDAEKDLREMVDKYILEDGGTMEGPGYWNYTFMHVFPIVYLLARYHKMPMEQYVWDKLKKTGDFALSMLSDEKGGAVTLPVNDAHSLEYNPIISSCYSRVSQDSRWKKLYAVGIRGGVKDMLEEVLILSTDIEEFEGEITPDGFVSLNTIGQTSLRRSTGDVGRVHLHMVAGPTYFAHGHADKSSFVLEVDGMPVLIDRGVCEYSNAYVGVIGASYNHNLLQPEAPEGIIAYTQTLRHSCPGGKVTRSVYENGVFDYEVDITEAWPAGIFRTIGRKVESFDPHVYFIYDDAVCETDTEVSFRLHTYGQIAQEAQSWTITQGDIQVTVTPVNYQPSSVKFGPDGVDQNINPVNSLKLYREKAGEHHLVTAIEVSRPGKAQLKVLPDSGISYMGVCHALADK